MLPAPDDEIRLLPEAEEGGSGVFCGVLCFVAQKRTSDREWWLGTW